MADILIIGIGNIFRGDDAVGLAAARMLREMQLPGVKVLELDGDLTALAEGWQGAQMVVVIDAVTSKSAAGAIFRFVAHEEPLPQKMFATCCSCHAFGVAQQIEIARSLNQLPPCLIVYGIEGKDFTLGSALSPEVARAAQAVVRQIIVDLGLGAMMFT
ncbi:MAG: hydrogenase maturation protease [Deltaproteobacteria bacterium]|nr:hydrogenase maturation protease [Deltaproteobacteria bacterium]